MAYIHGFIYNITGIFYITTVWNIGCEAVEKGIMLSNFQQFRSLYIVPVH